MLDRPEFPSLFALVFSGADFFVVSLDSYCWHTYVTLVSTLEIGVLNAFISKIET